jgi:hypothetical protein
LPPDLSENDTIVLRCSGYKSFGIEGSVKRIEVNNLTIDIKNPEHFHVPKVCPRNCNKQGPNHIRLVEDYVKKQGLLIDVRFKQTRVPVKLEKTALAIVEEQKLAKFFFPSVSSSVPTRIRRFVIFRLLDPKLAKMS